MQGDERLKRQAGSYLVAQSVAASIWWLAVLLLPSIRTMFVPSVFPEEFVLTFLFPDLLLYIGAGFIAASQLLKGTASGASWLYLHAGANIYAAMFTVAASVLSGDSWLGAACMLPSAVVTGIFTWRIWRG